MKTLVIAGKGHGYMETPTNHDRVDEIWGVNDYFMQRYCDLVFEMHDFSWSIFDCFHHVYTIIGDKAPAGMLWKRAVFKYHFFREKAWRINEMKLPLLSPAKYDESNPVQGIVIPTSIEYPLAEVLHKVCKGRDYLVGSISGAIAYALYLRREGLKDFDRMELYGCNLSAHEEWGYQRPNTEWLLSKVEEDGVEVQVIGAESKVLLPPGGGIIYGFKGTYPKLEPQIQEGPLDN
jgi:hypothetical protein